MGTPRIGFFSHDFYPIQGGQGRNFFEIFTRLQHANEFEVLAFSPCTNTLQNHHTILGFTNALPFSQLQFSLFLNLRLGKIIADHSLDMVFLNGGPGGILLLKKPHVPVVYCGNHTYVQQSQLIENQRWKRILIPLEKHSYRCATKMTALSSSTQESLIRYYDIPDGMIERIPSGVDTEVFAPDDTTKLPHSIFFLGRLDHRKGVRFLLDALPAVQATVSDVVLYLGGSGKQIEELKALVRDNRLEDHVQFLGKVPEPELPAWYRKCQIQVVPSVFEGFGIVALEALASGVPVIATKTPGLTDIIEDSENGFLVEYGDGPGLADRIIQLLTNTSLRAEFSQNARKSVLTSFQWEHVVEMYRQFFVSVLHCSREDSSHK